MHPVELARLGGASRQYALGCWTDLWKASAVLMRGKVPPVAQRRKAATELRRYHLDAVLPQAVNQDDKNQCAELARIIEGL